MMSDKKCDCEKKSPKVVFACSGAADVGELTDLVARKLNKNKLAQMKCLAFVGAGIPQMIDSVKNSDCLVIDGCNLDCGKLTMERNGLASFTHLRLSDLGYVKGSSPAEEHRINAIYKVASDLL